MVCEAQQQQLRAGCTEGDGVSKACRGVAPSPWNGCGGCRPVKTRDAGMVPSIVLLVLNAVTAEGDLSVPGADAPSCSLGPCRSLIYA
jgi:hypothetical protein